MKICIVGGGSAGWMSATTFVRCLDAEVTLIESSNIDVSGVGESTLGKIQTWIDLVGIREDEIDFIRETGATLKHSIKFTDFLEKGSGSFHYPFGDEPLIHPQNWWDFKCNSPKDFLDRSYGEEVNPLGLLAERGKFDMNSEYAYHFDAIKFGQFLRKKYCTEVNHILGEVIDCELGESGIKSLKVGSDKGFKSYDIEADLFIDCTGFKSLLLGQFLQEPYISYESLLPNDSAWATHISYVDKEKMCPYTECTAINNGWVWKIPLWDSIGTGYVNSSKHISHEDAKQEFIDHLGTSDCEFIHIPMKIGRYKRTWVKNVVAIGLSGGFIEPLESNGLFTVHQNLLALYKTLRRGKVSQLLKDFYNKGMNVNFDTFADFVAVHYAFTKRTDTSYWKDIFNKEYDNMGLETFERYGFILYAYELYRDNKYQHLSSGFHYIAASMGLIPFVEENNDSSEVEKMIDIYDQWNQRCESKPTMYEFLKENVYNNT